MALDIFARANTGLIRSVSESILKQTWLNNGRAEEDIPQLLDQFWTLYEQQLMEQPDYNDSYQNYAFIVLKTKNRCNVNCFLVLPSHVKFILDYSLHIHYKVP